MYVLELYMMEKKTKQNRKATWSSFNKELVNNICVGLKNNVLDLYLLARKDINGGLLSEKTVYEIVHLSLYPLISFLLHLYSHTHIYIHVVWMYIECICVYM